MRPGKNRAAPAAWVVALVCACPAAPGIAAVVTQTASASQSSGLLSVAPYPVPGFFGAGQITSHQELPDGRFYLMVMGLGRIILREQLQTKPYRKYRAEPLAEAPIDEASAAQQIKTFFACVQQLAQSLPEIAKAMKDLSPVKGHAGQLADVAASLFVSEPVQRQGLLEILDPQRRLQQVTDALGELILKAETHKKSPLN